MNKENISQPIDAVLAITYRCNSRCRMCNIWQKQEDERLKPEDYQKLPNSLKYINISGGEPFLCSDLIEIIKVVKQSCPGAKIVISTNGLATDLIVNKLKQIKKDVPGIGIAISLDGIGKVHDEIRRVPGAFARIQKTLEILRDQGFKNIKIAYTLSDVSQDQFRMVYDFAKKNKLDFSCTLAHSSEFYFGEGKKNKFFFSDILKDDINYIIKSELRGSIKAWLRAYYLDALAYFVKEGKRTVPCEALDKHFFMDPFGDIYPCPILNQVAGNIKNNSFEEIWCGEKANNIRKVVNNCRDKGCWMICTARTSMRKHPMQIGSWILKNKLKK